MSFLDATILGIVEGLTEFLPVSSTGHLILASTLLSIPQTDFVKSFEIAIQLGAILAVLVYFWRSFLSLAVLKRILVAFIPTGVVGFLLYRVIKDVFIGNELVVVCALALGGIAILLIESITKHKETPERDIADITYKQSFAIGLAQSLAVIPGVSRSGATVMGGLLLSLPRTTILTFSFLLAVPTMIMATGYDVYKNPTVFADANLPLLAVGFSVAFLTALLVIRYALAFVKRFTFIPFALYRLFVALIFFLFIL